MRASGVTVAGALSPQRTKEFAKAVVDAGVDLFVIRGTTVSAEHVSSQAEPLNLKEFIYELDVPVIVGGCATYQAGPAPDAHRRGRASSSASAAVRRTRPGPCSAWPCRWPPRWPTSPPRDATTWTSPAAGTSTSSLTASSAAPATSPRRSPAVPTRSWSARRSPGPRTRPARASTGATRPHHADLPRGERVAFEPVGTFEEVLFGPSHVADGTMNLVGALKRAMATTGYTDLKEFQRIEVVVG